MTQKWVNRENKQKAKRKRMPKHGMSLFTIEEITKRRADKIKSQNKKNGGKDKRND